MIELFLIIFFNKIYLKISLISIFNRKELKKLKKNEFNNLMLLMIWK